MTSTSVKMLQLFRSGPATPPPFFLDRKDFKQSHCNGNLFNLNFYICNFSVAPKLWILHRMLYNLHFLRAPPPPFFYPLAGLADQI